MMKKKLGLVLLAVVFVFSMVTFGCGSSGGGEGEEDEPYIIKTEKDAYSSDATNSKGNKAKIPFSELKLGLPSANEEYILSFECTSDVDIAQSSGKAIAIAIVDSSADAGYWDELSEWVAGSVTGGVINTENNKYADIVEVKKDAKITFTGTAKIAKAPTTTKASDVVLVFACDGQPWANQATLTCTKWEFKKK